MPLYNPKTNRYKLTPKQMGEERDLKFISGDFFNTQIPKEKMYLLKYFWKPAQKAFLKYIMAFDDHHWFADHTGVPYSHRTIERMKMRYHLLLRMHAQAQKDMDFDLLEKIEKGKIGKKKYLS